VTTVLLVVAATIAAALLAGTVPLGTLSLIYLMAVLFSARHFGLWPALLGVLLSVNAYNYFFIPPRFTFRIDDPADIATLIVFSIVSLVVSNLTAESRRQMQSIAEHARLTEEHYAFSRRLIGIGTVDALLAVVSERIDAMFRCEVAILLPSADGLAVRSTQPSDQAIDATDVTLARRCQGSGEACRREQESAGGVSRLYLPLRSTDGVAGVVIVGRTTPGPPEGAERASLDAVIDQAAVAIERIGLVESIEGARRIAEGEKLRNAVLTAISHDLRTPLSGIIGALTSLARPAGTEDERTRQELMSVALDESERLDRFVGNMLDMAKLEAGGVRVRAEPIDLGDVVSEAIGHAGSMLRARKLIIALPADLPLALADPALLERVVFNLLDNAAKHSPPAAPITITGDRAGETVLLRVADEGRGLGSGPGNDPGPSRRRDRARGPTGLGLSICRGFLQAMGGGIDAANRDDRRGAVFTVRLPMAAPVHALDD
jgi:two-component system sensor histidine kinase KdpD